MLGDKLKALREQLGFTQQEMADKIGIARGTYAHYEINRREPDIDTIRLLADFFGVTTDYLLGKIDNSNPEAETKKPQDLRKILEQHEIMFDGVPIDEDSKEDILHIIEFELYKKAKKMNKRK